MKVKKFCVSILISLIMLTIGTNVVKATTNENFHNFTGMYIKTESIKEGEKVYVDFYGNTNDIIEVRAEVVLDDTVTVVKIEDLNTSNPYFVMPEGSKSGFYEMVRVIVECEHGLNSYSTKLGEKNYTNCFEKKYFELEKARVDVELTNLSLASHYTTIKNGDKLWLDVEFKGIGYAEFVTMVVKNKENPDMKVLVSLKETNRLQYIDVFDIGTQTKLEDGTYYISDLYINPDKEDYIHYSLNLDETDENAKLLEYYVEFIIDSEVVHDEEIIKNDNNIIEDENENNNENENNEKNPIEENENKADSEENIVDNNEENKESENDKIVNSDIKDEIEEKTENEDNSFKVKIYELLLKILELLSIM